MTLPKLPESLVDVCSGILQQPAPVVVLDTCCVLDVLRSQHRLHAPRRLVQNAQRAIDLAAPANRKLHLLIQDEVEIEFNRNVEAVRGELANHFQTLLATGTALLEPADLAAWTSSLISIESDLNNLTNRIIKVSCVVSADPLCMARAQSRLARSIAPGRKGSSNLGDCIIAEHLLEVVTTLRNQGFNDRCIFVSSNIKDFGPIGSPKTHLDQEFGNLNIEYLPDIDAAISALNI